VQNFEKIKNDHKIPNL